MKAAWRGWITLLFPQTTPSRVEGGGVEVVGGGWWGGGLSHSIWFWVLSGQSRDPMMTVSAERVNG